MSAAPRAILFDFDGTLVDSAPGILEGLGRALAVHGVNPVVPLEASIIGPPLRHTLARLAGSEDVELIERLAAAFRDEYDTRAYRATQAYPGVGAMLETLQTAGVALHIVTNKRIAATRLILEHFAWMPRFAGVHALDSRTPPATHKPALVRAVMDEYTLAAATTWMIGDSAEDRRAALENRLRFFAAGWGYGGAAGDALAEPKALLRAAGL